MTLKHISHIMLIFAFLCALCLFSKVSYGAEGERYGGLTFGEIQGLDASDVGDMDPQQLARIIAALEAGSRDSDSEDETFEEKQQERRRIAAAQRIQAAYRAYQKRKRERLKARTARPPKLADFLGANSGTYSTYKEDRHERKMKWKPTQEEVEPLSQNEVLFERAKKKWLKKNKGRAPGWQKIMLESLRDDFPKEVKRAMKSLGKSSHTDKKSSRTHRKAKRF